MSSEWLSIRRKLPLLISAMLCAVVAALSWTSYRHLEGALVIAAGDRVAGVAMRLAGMLDESARRLRRDLRQLGGDSAIVRFVERPDATNREQARLVLERARSRASQSAWLEIRSAEGVPLLTAGNARSLRLSKPDRAVVDTAAGSSWIGPFVAIEDSIYFSVVSAILRSARDTLGFVVEYRRFTSAQGSEAIRGLIGADAAVLLGNSDGSAWSDFARVVHGPPTPLRYSAPREFVIRDGTRRLGAAAIVPRTPWSVWIELPDQAVLSPARAFLREIAAIALLVIVAGAFGAWVLSRHITAPLLDVMRASQDISNGDYSRRAAVGRLDEVGQLAVSFNRMANQIEESKRDLEARVSSRTAELRDALQGLERAQEELVRRERLAILGQLAGGVGHELRNPLGVMTNALYYLGIVLHEAPPDVKEYLDILRTQVGLSEKIVGDLLDFARVKAPNREAVTLVQLVTDQLQRVSGLDAIQVKSDFPDSLPAVVVDRVQIGQVILNLLTNAVQAMTGPAAGERKSSVLTLRGRMVDAQRVQLEVTDSGTGIKLEHLDKIFEPLFTTKARGIGLGLAVSRSLVRANDGDISVASRPGEGTSFTVTLPAVQATARATAA